MSSASMRVIQEPWQCCNPTLRAPLCPRSVGFRIRVIRGSVFEIRSIASALPSLLALSTMMNSQPLKVCARMLLTVCSTYGSPLRTDMSTDTRGSGINLFHAQRLAHGLENSVLIRLCEVDVKWKSEQPSVQLFGHRQTNGSAPVIGKQMIGLVVNSRFDPLALQRLSDFIAFRGIDQHRENVWDDRAIIQT